MNETPQDTARQGPTPPHTPPAPGILLPLSDEMAAVVSQIAERSGLSETEVLLLALRHGLPLVVAEDDTRP